MRLGHSSCWVNERKFLAAVCSERTEGHKCMASRKRKGTRAALYEKMPCPEVDEYPVLIMYIFNIKVCALTVRNVLQFDFHKNPNFNEWSIVKSFFIQSNRQTI